MAFDAVFFEDFISYAKRLFAEADGVPARASFKSTSLPELEKSIYVLERTSGMESRVTLTGSALDTSTIYSFRPSDVFSRFKKEDWDLYNRYLDAIFFHKCGAFGTRQYDLGDGVVLDASSVTFPLLGDAPDHRVVVGLMQLSGNGKGPSTEPLPLGVRSRITEFNYIDAGFGLPPKISGVL